MSNDFEKKGPDKAAESEFPVDEDGPITPPDRPGPIRVPGRDSQVPYDSILGSAAEPVNAGRGIVPTDHEVHDADKTHMLEPDSYNEPPQDSILDDLAQDPSMMIDLEREQKSIRLMPDTMIANRFKVVKELGVGGMGAVYLVEDIKLQERRALKVMLPRLVADTVAQQRFLTEIKVLQRLSHEAIVRVHDLGVDEDKGLQFFTMEHLPGKTLHKYLHEQGRSLPPAEVIDIAQKLCRALMYAHGKTIHRDLKPANVMLDENMNLTILDFGLAKLMTTAHLQMSNMVMGTFHYQSPEQRYDPTKVDRRTDLFSLGVMIYEMLTGEIPSGNFEPPSKVHKGIPKKLDRIVMRCLQNKPERRYQSAGELYDDLESAKSGLGPFPFSFPGRKRAPRPDETTPPLSTPGSMTPQPYVRPRGSFGWVLPVAMLLVVVVGIAYFVSTRGGGETGSTIPLPELRQQAHELSQQVEDNEDVKAYANIQRIRGNTSLGNADAAFDTDDEKGARVEYDNAIKYFEEAIEAAAAAKQVSELRNGIVGDLNRFAEVDDPFAKNLLFQADDAYRDAMALIEDQEIPDYVEALGILQAVRISVDAIPNYLAMVPQKEQAEGIHPQIEQRIAELQRKDQAYDSLRSAIDEVVALTANAVDAERGDNYTEALSIYEQVADYPATLDEKIAAIEAEQREIVASARAPAENQLAALRERAATGDDVGGTADAIEALLQEAADAEANGAFTQAKTILAKAEQESGAMLARLQTEAELEQQLRDRVLLAKNELESAQSTLDELGGNPAEDAKESYELFIARRTEAEAAEAAGNLDEAGRLYDLARREVENVAGAINVAAGERLRLAARDKVGELRSAYEALNWDGDAPESFQTAMARYDEAESAEDVLRARQLYNESGDEFDKAIQFVEAKRIEIRQENEERIRLAKLEAEEARSSIPQTLEGYVQSELDALKQVLADASAAAADSKWDESYGLYAKATDGFKSARSAGINQAVESELKQAEAKRAAAEQSRQAAIQRAGEVEEARLAQGQAERTKADRLWEEAESYFNSEAAELEKLNQISLASRRYTEADSAYKKAFDLYEQKSQAEIQAEREMRLREDAMKGLKDLEGLNSPFKSVGELRAKSEAEITAGRFDVAVNTIDDAKKLHTNLQTAAANAQQARAQADQQIKAFPASNAPKDAASYAKYQEASTAFQQGDTLRGEEKFGPATESFQLAMNNAATALRTYQQEQASAATVATQQQQTQPAVTTVPPAASGGGDLATAQQAALLAQAKVEEGPDKDRYSRRDKAKAKQLMEQASKASSPQQQIALFTEAKEFYEKMQPQVSSTGGR